jgi:hypothetical protein
VGVQDTISGGFEQRLRSLQPIGMTPPVGIPAPHRRRVAVLRPCSRRRSWDSIAAIAEDHRQDDKKHPAGDDRCFAQAPPRYSHYYHESHDCHLPSGDADEADGIVMVFL